MQTMQQALVGAGIATTWGLGDGCWNGEPYYKRRTYYRHRDRYNRSRRLKYIGEKQSTAQLGSISIPAIPAVVIYFYRPRKNEPLHALGIEL